MDEPFRGSSMAEHSAVNRRVVGSSPTPGARRGRRLWAFGRAREEEPAGGAGAALAPGDAAVVLEGDDPWDSGDRKRAWRELRALVAEAVVLQDGAEEVLDGARDQRPLGELAPRGGPLVRRFFALREALPVSDDPEIARLTGVLRPVLHHHAVMVAGALDLLAVAWRSERVVDQLRRLEGLGPPAARLDAVWAELQAEAPRRR